MGLLKRCFICLVAIPFSSVFAQEVVRYENFEDFAPTLSRQDGKTYVINFWATWCAPCIRELPYFEQLNSSFSNNDLEVILVSLDFQDQFEEKVIPFINKKSLKSKVIHLADPRANQWIDLVDPSWSGAIPATYIYNSKKRQFYEGAFKSYEELENIVKTILILPNE